MKRLLVIAFLCLILTPLSAWATWNSFYIQTTGDDLSAGSTTANAAAFTYAGGTFVRATGVFTTAGENPLTDGVLVGDWVSIYTTVGATGATFVAQVDGRDATTITVDITTDKIGATTTVSEGAGEATLKVAGAWASSAIVTSLFVSGTTTIPIRVDWKAGTYNPDATSRAFALAGTTLLPIWWRGYETSIGDLDDGTHARVAGTNLPLITFSTGQMTVAGAHQIFSNLAITSACVTTNGAVSLTGGNIRFFRSSITNSANNILARALSTLTVGPCHFYGMKLTAHTAAAQAFNISTITSCVGITVTGGVVGIGIGNSTALDRCVVKNWATTGISVGLGSIPIFISQCNIYAPTGTNGILINPIPTTGHVTISNTIISGGASALTNGINNSTGGNTNGVSLLIVHFSNVTNHIVGLAENADYNSDLGVAGYLLDNDTFPWTSTTDFTLAAGNAVDKSSGFPGAFEGETFIGYPDIGAVRHVDPASTGGAMFISQIKNSRFLPWSLPILVGVFLVVRRKLI